VKKIFEELEYLFNSLNYKDLDKVIDLISKNKGNIFCLGAGRMGYSIQAFSMRLSHLGFNSYMLGDSNLPKITPGDLVLINSSSGETKSIVLLSEIAKNNGAKLVCFSYNEASKIASMSDHKIIYSHVKSFQLMKTIYEQFSFLLFDHISMEIANKIDKSIEWIESNHSILE
jgi:6-phospho-3-hexuloisomerase